MERDAVADAERLPRRMRAQVVRRERYGEPIDAFREEELAVPAPGPGEVLLRVMAAGVNPNGVFAALGAPLDVIASHRRDGWEVEHHVPGSDASGTVVAVGPGVAGVRPGDAVLVHGGVWRPDCPHVRAGHDPALSPSFRAWGYQTPWGSFAEYALVQAHQCLPKPGQLTWEQAAAFMICGSTVLRMLRGWPPHVVRRGELVLVWGGAGGLGTAAIQLVAAFGGETIAVVSNPERAEFCTRLGALGCIDRNRYTHWGPLPEDTGGRERWLSGARAFRDAVRAFSGGRDPGLVIEHPGRDTLPSSMFVCAPGGMVVTCAGTSGFIGSLDLRTTWLRSKRLQGSHGMNDADAAATLALVADGRIDPCVSRVMPFEEVGAAHQLLRENRQPPGNIVVLVGAERPGLGRTDPDGGRRAAGGTAEGRTDVDRSDDRPRTGDGSR
jgi:crotonyl-CoA carboxylase/reductase